MIKQFEEGELETLEQEEINCLILSQAGDTAERLTELECKANGIKCWKTQMESDAEVSAFTEEAQDIFNVYYGEQISELYALLNAQLKVIK